MPKPTVLRTAAVLAGSATLTLVTGHAVAAASPPDVVGEKYSVAAAALSKAGLNPVISVTVGSRLPQDQCIVTSIVDHKYLRPESGATFNAFGWGEVALSLNCNGGYATAGTPGASLGSPEGRKAAAYDKEVRWRSQNPQWCTDAMREHPEWGEMEGCTYK